MLLLSVFFFLFLFSSPLESQSWTFSPGDFTIVKENSMNKNSTKSYGFVHLGGSTYQLTSSACQYCSDYQYSASAMWHNNKLNLLEDWIFECRLYFSCSVDSFGNKGSDGICFSLNQLDTATLGTAIGKSGGYLGYGYSPYENSPTNNGNISPIWISPSFGIEFDAFTCAQYPYYKWCDSWDTPGSSHISYLKNGDMTSNNFNTANISDPRVCAWHCVVIVWKRTNGINNDAGFDLSCYFIYEQQTSYNQPPTITRHFNSISDLVSSASTLNPYVTWGISAGTGGTFAINSHQVEFISMLNGTNIFPPVWKDSSTKIATLKWEGDSVACYCKQWLDTLWPTNCGGWFVNRSFIRNDTIRARICTEQSNITINLDTAFKLYPYHRSWAIETAATNQCETIPQYNDSASFPVWKYRNFARDPDSMIVRLILGNDTLGNWFGNDTFYINIIFIHRDTVLRNFFRDSVFKDTLNRIYPMDTNTFELKLPQLKTGCSYSLSYNVLDTSIFISKPQLLGKNKDSLYFVLKPNVTCEDILIKLTNDCGDNCPEEYSFTINKLAIRARKVRSCAGVHIQLQYCNNNLPNFPVTFYLYNSNGKKVDSSIGKSMDKSIIVPGQYTYKYYNSVTGKMISFLDTIKITQEDINSKIIIHSPTITMEPILKPPFDTASSCSYTLSYLIEGIDDTNYTVTHSKDYPSWGGKLQKDTVTGGYIYTIEYELACDSTDASPKLVSLSVGPVFSGFLNNPVCIRDSVALPSCCDFLDTLKGPSDTVVCTGIVNVTFDGYYVERNIPPYIVEKKYYIDIVAKLLSSGANIVGVHFESLSSYSMELNDIILLNPSDTFRKSIYWVPCLGEKTYIDLEYKICFDIQDSLGGITSCCDIYRHRYSCRNLDGNVHPEPPNTDIVTLCYSLNNLPLDDDTLTIRIDDMFDITRVLVYKDVPIKLLDTIALDISFLPSGLYNVIFQLCSELVSVPLIKYDAGIIEYADIVPNSTSSISNINYILTELPKVPLAITVIDKVTGITQLSFTSMPSGLSGSILLDVSSLSVGPYIVILEVENSMFVIPKTLQVNKQ